VAEVVLSASLNTMLFECKIFITKKFIVFIAGCISDDKSAKYFYKIFFRGVLTAFIKFANIINPKQIAGKLTY